METDSTYLPNQSDSQKTTSYEVKTAEESSRILTYTYNQEQESQGRLLIFLPGIGTNVRSQDTSMRRIKKQDYPSFHYDSMTAVFSDTQNPFNMDDVIEEFSRILAIAQNSFNFNRVVLFGSSFGAGCAVRLAQYLNERPTSSYTLDALLLLMPCLNQESIRGNVNIVKLLKNLPRPIALGTVRGTYKARTFIGSLVGDPSETEGSIEARFSSLTSIPERSLAPLDPHLPVHTFFSPNDLYINNKRVLRDLGMITAEDRITTHTISATGISNHNLKPNEYVAAAREHFLPILEKTWKERRA